MTLDEFVTEWNDGSDSVLVHTSGSTGKPKPMRVLKRRMEASARMTCARIGLAAGDTSLLCLPLDYIAGKMVVLRSLVWGLRLVCVPPSSHPLASLSEAPAFAAMVPMQVYASLQVWRERELLAGIRNLIIGGGAVDKSLEAELRKFPNAVWSTYGMTETLSHIALRRLSGPDADEWYTPFDGVGVSLAPDNCLVINAPMVCPGVLCTNDIAEMHDDGRRFRILGRKGNVIDSGGIKMSMEAIEEALRGRLTVPYIVTKRSDKLLGEAVVLLVATADLSSVKAVCEASLPHYWRPKAYISVSRIPLTATGKPARAEALKIAAASVDV